MKTKLLRKVRKEFKIEYWPNGRPLDIFRTPCAILRFKERDISLADIFFYVIPFSFGRITGTWGATIYRGMGNLKDQARVEMIWKLRSRYPHLGSYRKKFTKQQIWP